MFFEINPRTLETKHLVLDLEPLFEHNLSITIVTINIVTGSRLLLLRNTCVVILVPVRFALSL